MSGKNEVLDDAPSDHAVILCQVEGLSNLVATKGTKQMIFSNVVHDLKP